MIVESEIPVGSEILVNTATEGNQFRLEITALPNGGFVITWGGSSHGIGGVTGDSSGSAVKAQVFAADGSQVSSEILVNAATEGNQVRLEITALPNGGFVITWVDSSSFAVYNGQVFLECF